ncbi:hypothetical protein [Streptomyces sp. NPDC019890]|uniref:hypothetical protein n=1 Tax=Streptomyces sp. NPDC019890 TaxID=3365064 RepID=UPI00384D6ACA
MFEIRIICQPTEIEPVTKTLTEAFTIGPVRRYHSRDGKSLRLYITAEHRPTLEAWPTPEQAYAKAPSIISEIGWAANQAASGSFGDPLGRDFWLRKAAVLDRLALPDEAEHTESDATEAATTAAWRLLDRDRDNCLAQTGQSLDPDLVTRASADPRGYVRHQYALWATNK